MKLRLIYYDAVSNIYVHPSHNSSARSCHVSTSVENSWPKYKHGFDLLHVVGLDEGAEGTQILDQAVALPQLLLSCRMTHMTPHYSRHSSAGGIYFKRKKKPLGSFKLKSYQCGKQDLNLHES